MVNHPENSVHPAEKDKRRDIRGLLDTEAQEVCLRYGEPKFRATQLLDWLYKKRVSSWEQMTNLSKSMREQLAGEFELGDLKVDKIQGAADTTRKFLLRLRDGEFIETVLVPASLGLYGDLSDRHTLCVSTQVGCAYGCAFCASCRNGFRRNLSAGEIVGQLLTVEKETGDKVNNIVFMGMGEPLANYDEVWRAIRIFNGEWGLTIGARRMTLSTCGLAPEIKRMAREPLQVRLAISLHGATDEIRNRLMPVNRRYPLSALIPACEEYLQVRKRLITFEYVLVAGINDSRQDAVKLSALARCLRAKINLIPFNKVRGAGFDRPSDEACQKFCDDLAAAGVGATLRLEKGGDIDAACGQLRLQRMTFPNQGTRANAAPRPPFVAK
ncbi:MAG: 23S rRNA (adenine(2503)-C(2))-methyltransferase RlmN [Verrucomicrobiae bacterium]|nr:23S rRNA (adenine(2503)-C(2))-methyltransferase RlmN [Verrucomicrobiae bacterium]